MRIDYYAILAADYEHAFDPVRSDASLSVRRAYHDQKRRAKRYGIGWSFPFRMWRDWWGENIALRGRRSNDLCMARYDDEGPYHPDNVYLATNDENNRGPRTIPPPGFIANGN